MAHDVLLPEDLRTRIDRVATDLCYCSDHLDSEPIRNGDSPDSDERATLHEVEREMLAPLLADDFDVVGVGVARCVLRFPGESSLSEYVVKLARFGDDLFSAGFVQNKREALLMIHGADDGWADQPRIFEQALQANGWTDGDEYEYIELSGVGHSPKSRAVQIQWWRAIVDFLNRRLSR